TDPRADRNHQLVARDSALVGLDRGHRVPGDAEPGDADAGRDLHAFVFRLRRQAANRADVVRVATLLLVQHRRASGCLPVIEHVEQVALTVGLSLDQHGGVANGLLLGVDLRHVFGHRLRGNLQEADRMVGERVGVALPYGHRMRHQLAHRGLEVVVADGAAGDAGRTRAGSALIEHEDVLAPAQSAGSEFPGQMPGRGQAVNARADNDVPAMCADHGTRLSTEGARQHRLHATARASLRPAQCPARSDRKIKHREAGSYDGGVTEEAGAGAPRRRSYPKGVRRRQQILQSAIALFARQGVDRASLRSVGEAIGVSHAALRHYFSSRDELLVEVYRTHEALTVGDASAADESAVGVIIEAAERNRSIPGLVELYATLTTDALQEGHAVTREFVCD